MLFVNYGYVVNVACLECKSYDMIKPQSGGNEQGNTTNDTILTFGVFHQQLESPRSVALGVL